MNKYKSLLIITLALLATWSLRELFFRDLSNKDKDDKDTVSDYKTERVQAFSLSGFSESGKKIWEVEGKSADILGDIINLWDIDADSYQDDVTVNLKSDEGVFDRRNNNLELKTNVIIITDEGSTLRTDSLCWNAKEENISTEDYVYITRQDMDIEGVGASADPDLKIAQLNKNVRVDTKDPMAVITCDGTLKLDYDNNIAYFYENVKLDDGKSIITTDEATAYFDPEKRTFKKIVCVGNVDIRRGEDSTQADKLTYIPGEGRVILTGRPKIIIRSTEELLKDKAF